MKEYYFISEEVAKKFPGLEKSKPIDGLYGLTYYVAEIPDFSVVEDYIKNCTEDFYKFAFQCTDSLVSLSYLGVDYDEDDNEVEVECTLGIEACREWGLITAIEQELGLTKEMNIAYAIHKLAEQNGTNPIDFINQI